MDIHNKINKQLALAQNKNTCTSTRVPVQTYMTCTCKNISKINFSLIIFYINYIRSYRTGTVCTWDPPVQHVMYVCMNVCMYVCHVYLLCSMYTH